MVGCGDEDAKRVHQLFEQLAQLFWKRLHEPVSEPRGTSFSISGEKQGVDFEKLNDLLKIARKATLLYIREGAAKGYGSREYYYVPNRMLWPVRGLDPKGQRARVALRVGRLLAAARGERPLTATDGGSDEGQGSLFDGRDTEDV